MARSTIWLSYDLGVRGDYENLYTWLADHNAKECGDSLAVLVYEHKGDLVGKLTAELKRTIETDKRTRVYIVFRNPADPTKTKGVFVFGGRRAPPWAGYSSKGREESDDEG